MTKFNIAFLCLLSSFLFLTTACEEEKDADIAGIELDLDFKRLDQQMYQAAQYLQENKEIESEDFLNQFFGEDKAFFQQYLGMTDADMERAGVPLEKTDSLIGSQLKDFLSDSIMFNLLDTIQEVFPVDAPMLSPISAPIKRLKQLFPDTQMPAIRTHANGYIPGSDLRSADQLVSVPGFYSLGLHYFLGKDFPYYPENIYAYQRRRFTQEHMEVVVAKAIADEFVAPRNPATKRNLLDGMVHSGIKQYFIHQLLPYTPDSLLLYYNSQQMDWARLFEEENYSFLLDKLFDSDFKFQRNFLADKPYTTELSDESAPRIGEYMGWRIVDSYMKNNPDVSLEELCENTDYEGIFRSSGYKP